KMETRISSNLLACLLSCALFVACTSEKPDNTAQVSGAASVAFNVRQDATVFHLDNGMEVILVENHANPMITAFTIVRVGSRNEDAATNGAAHFLEHLLFNGTTRRTQKQLYDEMDFYGGYNNASTGPDYTSYMILMPREYIAEGMDIQADMLFNSTLPVEKFEKERGIVIEEIGKDSDRPGYQVDNHFLKVCYAGTPYERAVLGTVSTISHLEWERVMKFYQTWYVPNNMTMMVIGDFDTEEMISLVKEKYGPPGPGSIPPRDDIQLHQPRELDIETATAIGVFPDDKKFLTLGYRLPPPHAGGFQDLVLMTEFLGGKSSSILQKAFKEETNRQLVNSISAGLSFNRDFTTLKISAELPIDSDENRVLEIVKQGIRKIARETVSAEDVKTALIARATGEIYMQEKLHYFGMMKASYLAAGGYPLLRNYVKGLQTVTPRTIQLAAREHLEDQIPIATMMLPRSKTGVSKDVRSPNTYLQRTLDNGMTVVVQENADSPVIGVHLLAKDRAATEGKDKWGMTEILQRAVYESGTSQHPGDAFAQAVDAIGAELKVHDMPWIPYDDYYNSPRFVYVRLKVVDSFFGAGLDLLSEIVRDAQISESAFENARKQTLSISAQASNSTPVVAGRLFYDNLFVDNPGFGWVLGDTTRINGITFDDVKGYYQKVYNPANLILTVSGNIPTEKAMQAIEARFSGEWGESGWQAKMGQSQLSEFGRTVRTKLGKKQSYIYMANKFEVDEDDLPALRVLMTIFSDRIAFQLREREGLAYSISASAQSYGGERWYRIRMGTRPANIERASSGLKREINNMRTAQFEKDEVQKTINSILGRGGMRRLDRVGRAYYISMEVLDGKNPEADEQHFERMKAVSVDDVRRLAGDVFARDDHLVVVAE
ncbi:MAG: M16 family metallopeptidase, partial [bacterium]